MHQNFTPEDIIKYLYAEMEESESIHLMEWLLSDENAMEIFDQLSASKTLLDSISFQPQPSSVRKCIAHSNALALQHHSL
jgi:hypothetical protein